ncbi:enoyl-CoA hydratase-related protein [Megalodesulfovibrio gigas]|uniref:Putative enoyl-CoA hydratase/isomerase family protein n=1 Tax=Megalodesulfovibrio gigas (strain ATCC 19364 / DSM 1382 / NCIMB 9332 / VKM B-1759) TaxID=1121448 RepID=T2G9W0_MEGG1|nr:enoyl-CoA hydratase-related protein [Megalodesulfovibrio gigas]AGW13385.1 putative enoyl-CoA hydratase/isomerase family protein [Megalodesulfovibrio gigas DSM 1382 = ATCC 19364]
MDASSLLAVERRGPTAILRLNRPERRNAVDAALADAMRQALAEVGADPAVRAVILTGGETCFSAGMDLAAYLDGQWPAINDAEGRFAGVAAHRLEQPLIAAVEGPALAGGFETALACDMIVAGDGAFFGVPEVRVGLFPAAGGAFRLMRKVPPNVGMEILCTGKRLSAAEAHQLGLVNRLVPAGTALDAALTLAEEIARQAPLGVRASLTLARAALAAEEARLWELNDRLWQQITATTDAREGPRAFLEKREPVWTGS